MGLFKRKRDPEPEPSGEEIAVTIADLEAQVRLLDEELHNRRGESLSRSVLEYLHVLEPIDATSVKLDHPMLFSNGANVYVELIRLQDGGLLRFSSPLPDREVFLEDRRIPVPIVTIEGLKFIERWQPTADSLLVAIERRLAGGDVSDEEKSKLARLRDTVLDIGKDVVSSVLSEMAKGYMT